MSNDLQQLKSLLNNNVCIGLSSCLASHVQGSMLTKGSGILCDEDFFMWDIKNNKISTGKSFPLAMALP